MKIATRTFLRRVCYVPWRHWLQDAVQDIRYSLRQIRRSPQLASAVMLTPVIGIGLNSVAFSLFNVLTLADPRAYGSALLLIICAAGATLIPALRGAHAEPWLALKDG